MATSLDAKKRWRFEFMRALNEVTDGDQFKIVDPADIAKTVGIPENKLESLFVELTKEAA